MNGVVIGLVVVQLIYYICTIIHVFRKARAERLRVDALLAEQKKQVDALLAEQKKQLEELENQGEQGTA